MFRTFALRSTAVITAALLSSCASTTVIRTEPPGALVRHGGMTLGTTPYMHSDTEMTGNRMPLTIEKEGYEPEQITIQRDQWNGQHVILSVCGGFLCLAPFAGLLWSQDYAPEYLVRMRPKQGGQVQQGQPQVVQPSGVIR